MPVFKVSLIVIRLKFKKSDLKLDLRQLTCGCTSIIIFFNEKKEHYTIKI